MPPIRRRGPRGGLVSTRIPLNSINSVATNAANKRQPNEADQIDNALVSLERGFEKRAGFEVVPQNTIAGLTSWDTSSNNCRYDLYGLPTGADLFFYWYSINEDNTFLIAINYDATGATNNLQACPLGADSSRRVQPCLARHDSGCTRGCVRPSKYPRHEPMHPKAAIRPTSKLVSWPYSFRTQRMC